MARNKLILSSSRACDQVAELMEAFKAYFALERFISPDYADEEHACVPMPRAELGALLHILNQDLLRRIEALAHITGIIELQAQGRPDSDWAQER